MQGTIDGYSYGLITPVAGYIMACLGSALGLRCTVRSVRSGRRMPGWLALGAASIGCGIWTMHFIGMLGFKVRETAIGYDGPLTLASLLFAVVSVGVGVSAVVYRGTRLPVLLTAGLFTGLGVAGMHYTGMAAMQMEGTVRYDPTTVAVSVLIAVVAATAALWAAVSVRGLSAAIGASLVMGVAVTGMHYTGMAAFSVQLHTHTTAAAGTGSTAVVLPTLVGALAFLIVAGTIVVFDPLLILGDDEADIDRRVPSARR
ncbi:membrane protein [Streptomyces showdoensis]|uniref:Membrane protein n=1 Tax=Streptomyces showdoensis TaxID=68268 RepID=A0A2P2GK92_STREW|nr:MHYT domain-containing protein [Streptomyces showdoensis]KKZ71926.1 membrane protein [Streptomyces showdoensis]